jgi:NAD(P)-dependent dehydrogenase (short-subunit alcohol dehydrogenase family)
MDTVALVTGANRGIGLEVARQLAQAGMRVIVTARDEARAAIAAETLAAEGLHVIAMAVDAASADSVRRLGARVESDVGALDVLVNNAAAPGEWLETASAADLDAVRGLFETNVLGPWRLVQALLPLLRRSPHARIVNVSCGAGSHGDTDFGLTTSAGAAAGYATSKAALNALTVTLAAELAGTGILVNAVCPGLTATAPGMEEMGARPVADGARSVVWAAVLDDDGPSGGFFRDGAPLPW